MVPVLHLQYQQPPARMQQGKIRMQVVIADADVIPAQVIVFQVRLQTFCEASLPRLHFLRAVGSAGKNMAMVCALELVYWLQVPIISCKPRANCSE
jgi:hypothetical protein